MKIVENVARSLWDIMRNFDEGRWHLPSHQRKLVWYAGKMKQWFKDLIQLYKEGGATVPGCVIIYELPGNPKIYLNDGAQRVYWTIMQFISYCKEKDLNWKDILQSVTITVQKVEYRDISEAIRCFIQINYGTTATPCELTRTMFCETFDDFTTYWEPKLEKIHEAIKLALLEQGCEIEDRNEQRELGHKRKRDEYHMFWKFISGDTTQFSPQVALSNLRPDQWDKQTKLEKNLLEELKKISYADIDASITEFETFIKNYAALYRQIWLENKPATEAPSNVHFRWWLTVVIYLYNNEIKLETIRTFTEKLIKQSDGRTTLFYENEENKRCNCNTAMSKLHQLGMISNIIGLDASLLGYTPKRRKKKKRNLRVGFNESHVKNFSTNGNGDTLAENAVENIHRSARNMSSVEEERLKAIT
jgi:hypothetical protein